MLKADVGIDAAPSAFPDVAEAEGGLREEDGLTGQRVERAALIVQAFVGQRRTQFQRKALVVDFMVSERVDVVGVTVKIDTDVVGPVEVAAVVGVGGIEEGSQGINLGREEGRFFLGGRTA